MTVERKNRDEHSCNQNAPVATSIAMRPKKVIWGKQEVAEIAGDFTNARSRHRSARGPQSTVTIGLPGPSASASRMASATLVPIEPPISADTDEAGGIGVEHDEHGSPKLDGAARIGADLRPAVGHCRDRGRTLQDEQGIAEDELRRVPGVGGTAASD